MPQLIERIVALIRFTVLAMPMARGNQRTAASRRKAVSVTPTSSHRVARPESERTVEERGATRAASLAQA
ncbi:hypothetical protein [Streptomyces sp. NPDC059272]|uniref:hypothetical protein n=1 Tax=Streptomyces sp. NPDC059272 TaxID=3346800 RepID=UPI0036ADDE04